jgi:hypothetical protein
MRTGSSRRLLMKRPIRPIAMPLATTTTGTLGRASPNRVKSSIRGDDTPRE